MSFPDDPAGPGEPTRDPAHPRPRSGSGDAPVRDGAARDRVTRSRPARRRPALDAGATAAP